MLTRTFASKVSDIHFTEYVAKLTNVLGMELCKIFEEVNTNYACDRSVLVDRQYDNI